MLSDHAALPVAEQEGGGPTSRGGALKSWLLVIGRCREVAWTCCSLSFGVAEQGAVCVVHVPREVTVEEL